MFWSKPWNSELYLLQPEQALIPGLIFQWSHYLCISIYIKSEHACTFWTCTDSFGLTACIRSSLQPPDVTAHPDDDTLCALLRDIKVLSAGHLSPLFSSTSAHEKAGNLWANCLLWAVMANKSHVAHSWSGFCLHTKIKAHSHCHGYNKATFEADLRVCHRVLNRN